MYKKLSKQFAKFCLVGLFATFISCVIFYVLLETFNVNYLISSSVSFLSGIVAGYPLNKSWTFSSSNRDHKKIIKYLSVYLVSLVISLIFLRIVVGYYGLDAKIAYVLSIGITTCTNFLGTRFFVFEKL